MNINLFRLLNRVSYTDIFIPRYQIHNSIHMKCKKSNGGVIEKKIKRITTRIAILFLTDIFTWIA